ncbi:hypothetical protein [Actinocrispum sp. NPDC049592]|uniref:terpene synthase family protein n=1 Tax=Actinocrispum sp. NPDC049592 TaxID=3154835 RepID=UPI003435F4C1
MDHIAYPGLNVPFEEQISAFVDETEGHLSSWARGSGMIADEQNGVRFDSMLLGRLAARTYPMADQRSLFTLADWMGWFFLFDDTLDDTSEGRDIRYVRPIVRALDRILHQDPIRLEFEGDSPVSLALADLWRRTARSMPASWRKRFVRNMSAYLYAYVTQAEVNTSRRALTEESYVLHRLRSGAGFASIDLIEFAQNASLPDDLHQRPELQTLKETTSNVVCWSNDVFSAPKEITRGDLCNYVAVLQQQTQLPFQQCANMVCERILDQVRLFEDTEALLARTKSRNTWGPSTTRALGGYVKGLKAWMRGNIDWSLETARYRHRAIGSL